MLIYNVYQSDHANLYEKVHYSRNANIILFVRAGTTGCVHQGVHIRLKDRMYPVPYLCCILPACGVEQVDTKGNYSSYT
jgi:hypothetical protein